MKSIKYFYVCILVLHSKCFSVYFMKQIAKLRIDTILPLLKGGIL